MTIPSASGGAQGRSHPAPQVKREGTTATAPPTCRWEDEAEPLATTADPDAAAAQISAQISDADDARQAAESLAAREKAARITAEALADEARQMAEAMAGQAEAAQADAEAARADASAARAELRDKTIEHEAPR